MTTEQFKRAVETAHDNCKDTCIHADAFAPISGETVSDLIQYAVEFNAQAGGGPEDVVKYIVFNAIHIGYRLHQIEMEDMGVKA